MSPTVMAVIPARSGSKSIVHKNIREVGGYPLIAWSIAAAREARLVDRVVVSTDSREYADLAIAYGAEAPFLRPSELSGDASTDIDFALHLLEWLKENEESLPDYLLHLRPTCPNRIPEIIDAAIEAIAADPTATSLLCAHPVDYPPGKYYRLGEQGVFSGYMGEDFINMPRQMCPQGYLGNGYADLMSVPSLLADRSLYGPRRLAFVTPHPGDIDTEEDFIKMSAHLYYTKSPLKTYLNAIKEKRDSRHSEEHFTAAMNECIAGIAGTCRTGGRVFVAGTRTSYADALLFFGECSRPYNIGESQNATAEGLPVFLLGQGPFFSGSEYINWAGECLVLANPGDILLSFSSSGERDELLCALKTMKAKGGKNIVFTCDDDKQVVEAADLAVSLPSSDAPLIRESRLLALCAAIRAQSLHSVDIA